MLYVDFVAPYPYALTKMEPHSRIQKVTKKTLTAMEKLMQDIITEQTRECIRSQTTDV